MKYLFLVSLLLVSVSAYGSSTDVVGSKHSVVSGSNPYMLLPVLPCIVHSPHSATNPYALRLHPKCATANNWLVYYRGW